MVAAVRCPNAKCRKYMLVEQVDQGKIISCLICKQPVKVPQPGSQSPAVQEAIPTATVVETTEDLTPIFDNEEPQFRME
jgi:hypothetical protein